MLAGKHHRKKRRTEENARASTAGPPVLADLRLTARINYRCIAARDVHRLGRAQKTAGHRAVNADYSQQMLRQPMRPDEVFASGKGAAADGPPDRAGVITPSAWLRGARPCLAAPFGCPEPRFGYAVSGGMPRTGVPQPESIAARSGALGEIDRIRSLRYAFTRGGNARGRRTGEGYV